MPLIVRRLVVAILTVVASGSMGALSAYAQKLDRGFDLTMPAAASGDELKSQPDFWVMEVSFKPMRMIRVDVTDPKTGKKRPELIMYLVYRAVNRSQNAVPGARQNRPVNEEDPLPRPYFAPGFTLVTDDNDVQHVYYDAIIPEAQAAIEARERMDLKNSVEVVQPLPDPVPPDAENQNAITGVAMWRGVDPEADFFSVFMQGFSSGYWLTTGPDGKPLVWRKTIMHEYWRPGDEADQREREIRRLDEPKPSDQPRQDPRWIYRADGDTTAHPQDVPVQEEKQPEQPAKQEPAPAKDQPAPAKEQPEPAKKQAEPAKKLPAPAEKE
ncbi:MAG: hypothetical protein WD648_05855 [Planctomycetaceae bacterium]